MNIPVLTPRVEANQPRKPPYRLKKGKIAQRNLLVRFEARAGQRMGILANLLHCHLAVQIQATGLLGEGGQKKFVRQRSRTFVSEDVT